MEGNVVIVSPMTALGDKIKALRDKKGLSQNALAKRAKISQPVIAALEAGEQQTTKKLPDIARELGVPVTELDPSYGPPKGYQAPPYSIGEAFIDALSRAGVETGLVEMAADVMAAMRLQGVLEERRRQAQKFEDN